VEEAVDPSTTEARDVRALFEELESADDEAAAALFADTFLSLDPASASVVTNEQLRAALPRRSAMFAAAGVRATRLEHLHTRALDERHQLVSTSWTTALVDPDAEPLTLRSTYVVRLVDASWRIVLYLNHDDIAAELARRAA
jgi:hypothetical protein